MLELIERRHVKDAIVRVLLTLTPEQNDFLDERAVRAALAEAHVVAAISRNVDRGTRSRLGTERPPETLTPLEALALYLEHKRIPPDRREELLRAARALVAGDDAMASDAPLP
ncbi:MAG: hypothetical protein C4290_01130 [Chloroflexota bacterium]